MPRRLTPARWVYPRSGGFVFDPDALAGINAIIENGGTLSNSDKAAINTFILGLKADALWGTFAGLFLFVGGTDNAHSVEFQSRTLQISWVNTPVHSTLGVEFDGSASYGEIALGGIGGAYSIHLSAYINAQSLSSGATIAGTTDTGGMGTKHLSLYHDGSTIAARGVNDNVLLAGLTGSPYGFFGISRQDANNRHIYHSGVDFVADTEAAFENVGYAPYIGANNADMVPSSFAPCRLGFLSVGNGINLALLEPHVTALQVALGRP